MPITSFTVDGSEVNPKLESFEIRETSGGISTMTCVLESYGSPVERYDVQLPVVVQEDGVTIFAGTITQTREQGLAGAPNAYSETGAPQIATTITAEDYGRLAERVYVTETVAVGTPLSTFLATIVTYLAAQGVTLHGSQVTGPNLPAMVFDRVRASDVLQALTDATGYVSRIDYDKKLRMWLSGDLAAPFDINEDDAPPRWTGDVEVERILGDEYANRVTVVSDLITQYGREETFIGDGTTNTFTLQYTLFAHRGYVTYNGVYETLRTFGDPASWTYDATTNSLTRDAGVPANASTFTINFDGTFEAFATAEDAGEIAANGLVEYVEQRSDITDSTSAQALADALLAERLNAGDHVVTYDTRYPASTLRAGQQQTLTAPARDITGDHLIRDLRVRAETPVTADYAVADLGLIRTVTAKRNQVLGGKWQHTYRDWLGGGKKTPAVVQTGTGGVAQVGPGGPNTAVQYNDAGVFGGEAAFTYNKTTNCLVAGALSDITAVSPESCQVFGYDNHIEDA